MARRVSARHYTQSGPGESGDCCRDVPNPQRWIDRRPPPVRHRSILQRPPSAGRLFGGHAFPSATAAWTSRVLGLLLFEDLQAGVAVCSGLPCEETSRRDGPSEGGAMADLWRPLDGLSLRVGNVSTPAPKDMCNGMRSRAGLSTCRPRRGFGLMGCSRSRGWRRRALQMPPPYGG